MWTVFLTEINVVKCNRYKYTNYSYNEIKLYNSIESCEHARKQVLDNLRVFKWKCIRLSSWNKWNKKVHPFLFASVKTLFTWYLP